MTMTGVEPSKARAFWFALVDNAARLVVDADILGAASPRAVAGSPRTGGAWQGAGVAQSFWVSWSSGDEAPLDVPYLHDFGAKHRHKLMQSTHHVDGDAEFVSELRLFRSRAEVDLRPGTDASDPHQYVDYLESLADADNQAKQRGFYVDMAEDGALLVPHEIDRSCLADDIWRAADAVKSTLVDGMIIGDRDPRLDSIEALMAPILERDDSL